MSKQKTDSEEGDELQGLAIRSAAESPSAAVMDLFRVKTDWRTLRLGTKLGGMKPHQEIEKQ
jgi:hypothetical protein